MEYLWSDRRRRLGLPLSVTIQSSDRSCPVLELKNVKHPRETKEIIHQAVENMKIQRRMRVGEVMGEEHVHDDDDDYDDEDWSEET